MSKLEDLEKELYETGSENSPAKSRRVERIFFPRRDNAVKKSWLSLPKKREEGSGESNLGRYIVYGVFLLFALVLGVFIFFYLGTRGQEVHIAIGGDDRIEAGEVITLPVSFENASRTALREAELVLNLPQGSIFIEEGVERPAPVRITKPLEDFSAGEKRIAEFSVRIFGKQDEEKKIEATILYRPENIHARFSQKTEKRIVISSVPISFSWETPERVSKNQEVTIKLFYTLNSRASFDNLSLRFDYPPGFSFVSADPAPSTDNNAWQIGTLGPGVQGSITIRGKITGEEREVKTFLASLGVEDGVTKEWSVYGESTKELALAVVPLSLDVSLNGENKIGAITPGDTLSFTARYKNNTPYTIKNASVRVFLEGSVLDFSSLFMGERGVFDGETHSLLWAPGSVSELREVASDKEGAFTFSIRTYARPPVRSADDKNLRVKLRASISAVGIPEELRGVEVGSEDSIEFKVRSKIIFSGKSVYRTSPIVNSGPLPPRVGEKTFYTIIWTIRNFTNTLENAEVVAALPPNVHWENNFLPRNADFSFNDASGEIRWRIGTIPAGTGILTPALNLSFQVSVLPSLPDLGKALPLINSSMLRASDAFVGERPEENLSPLTTELREDPLTKFDDWSVVR